MSRLASSFRTLYYGLGNPAMRALPPREPNLGRRPFYAGPYYYSGLQYGGDEDFPTQRGLKRSVSGPREIETRTWGHLKSRPGPGQPSYVERFFMNLPFTVEAPTEPMGGYSQIPPPQPPEMAGGGGGGGYYYPGYGGGGGGYSYPEYTPTPQYFTEYRGGSRAARGGVAPRTPTMRTAAPPRAGPAYAPRLAQPPRYFQLLTSWRI